MRQNDGQRLRRMLPQSGCDQSARRPPDSAERPGLACGQTGEDVGKVSMRRKLSGQAAQCLAGVGSLLRGSFHRHRGDCRRLPEE